MIFYCPPFENSWGPNPDCPNKKCYCPTFVLLRAVGGLGGDFVRKK